MRVRVDNANDHVLELVLPRLQEGCTLTELLNGFDDAERPIVLGVIKDLSERGLLLNDITSAAKETVSVQEASMYAEQARFFSNYRARTDEPPDAEHMEFVDASSLLQHKLKESRILLIGLGRIGSRLASGLSYAGVGHIYGSDLAEVRQRDLIDSSYRSADAGQPREVVLQNVLRQVNPFIEYTPLGVSSLFEQDARGVPEKLDLLILCEDRFDPDQYAAMNQLCLNRHIPWTSCRNFGFKFEIGPLIVPYETACFHCLELRKAGNLSFYDDFITTQRLLKAQAVSLGNLNITLGYELLAVEVIKILTNFSRPMTYGSVFSFDLVTFEGKLHPVLKIPRCPECSNVARNQPTINIWDPNELFAGF